MHSKLVKILHEIQTNFLMKLLLSQVQRDLNFYMFTGEEKRQETSKIPNQNQILACQRNVTENLSPVRTNGEMDKRTDGHAWG